MGTRWTIARIDRILIFSINVQACYPRTSMAITTYFVKNINGSPERGRSIHASSCQLCNNSIWSFACGADGYILVSNRGHILNGLYRLCHRFAFGKKWWFDHQVDFRGIAVLPQEIRCSLELFFSTSSIDADVSDEVIR